MTREEFMKMHLNALYGTAVTYKFKSDRFKYANTDSIRKEKKTMKVVEHFEVPIEDIPDFLNEHIDETLIIRECNLEESTIKVDIKKDYTEPEFHMGVLFNISHSHSATLEERNACEYAINCIKTLIDMGVLNDDNSK